MESEITKPTKMSAVWRWLLIIVAIVFLIFVILTGTVSAVAYSNQDKVYPGIKVDDIDLGGLTKTQVSNILSGKFKNTFENGFVFQTNNEKRTITNTNEEVFSLNLESVVDKAYAYGRTNVWWQNYSKILSIYLLCNIVLLFA